MTLPSNNPETVRADLLKLIHRAVRHCDLRTAEDTLALAQAYAHVMCPGHTHGTSTTSSGGE